HGFSADAKQCQRAIAMIRPEGEKTLKPEFVVEWIGGVEGLEKFGINTQHASCSVNIIHGTWSFRLVQVKEKTRAEAFASARVGVIYFRLMQAGETICLLLEKAAVSTESTCWSPTSPNSRSSFTVTMRPANSRTGRNSLIYSRTCA